MVEEQWWESYGGREMVEEQSWESCGGRAVVEEMWWTSSAGEAIVETYLGDLLWRLTVEKLIMSELTEWQALV